MTKALDLLYVLIYPRLVTVLEVCDSTEVKPEGLAGQTLFLFYGQTYFVTYFYLKRLGRVSKETFRLGPLTCMSLHYTHHPPNSPFYVYFDNVSHVFFVCTVFHFYIPLYDDSICCVNTPLLVHEVIFLLKGPPMTRVSVQP